MVITVVSKTTNYSSILYAPATIFLLLESPVSKTKYGGFTKKSTS